MKKRGVYIKVFKIITVELLLIILSLSLVIIPEIFINHENIYLIMNNVVNLEKDITLGVMLIDLILNLFLLRIYILINIKKKSIDSDEIPEKAGNNEFGSSRFMTNKEIKIKFKSWNPHRKLKAGGIVVTKLKGKYYYDESSNHTLVIGSTGSGKTVSTIMPLIFNLADAGESMVINDTKGELYSKTYNYLKENNYDIKILNMRNPLSSDTWNPLHLPYKYYKEKNEEKMVELVDEFSYALCKNVSSKDPFWEESSASVLSALVYGLIEDAKAEDEVHLNSIYNLLVSHGNKSIGRENSLDKYFNDKPFGNIAKNSYATGNFAKGETRATIFSVLASKLKIFNDIGVATMTASNKIKIRDIGLKKTAVFLIIPDEKEARHVLASLFVNQVYQELVEESFKREGKLPLRVNFILDEFSNMPPIKNFSNKITVSRSRNIRFYLVVQDFSQLKNKYKNDYGTIKSNCNNWIYLLTADNDTAKEISTKLGKYTINTSRESISNRLEKIDFNFSNDRSLTGRELLTADELMKFNYGEAIFFKGREDPIKSKIPHIKEYGFDTIEKSLPNEMNVSKIQIFNLDKVRRENKIKKELGEIELIDP